MPGRTRLAPTCRRDPRHPRRMPVAERPVAIERRTLQRHGIDCSRGLRTTSLFATCPAAQCAENGVPSSPPRDGVCRVSGRSTYDGAAGACAALAAAAGCAPPHPPESKHTHSDRASTHSSPSAQQCPALACCPDEHAPPRCAAAVCARAGEGASVLVGASQHPRASRDCAGHSCEHSSAHATPPPHASNAPQTGTHQATDRQSRILSILAVYGGPSRRHNSARETVYLSPEIRDLNGFRGQGGRWASLSCKPSGVF